MKSKTETKTSVWDAASPATRRAWASADRQDAARKAAKAI